jgi:alkylation response protein AidB-like acyl-CoA dehydrogenase/predicted heme/steroid binding protein
MQEYTLDQVSVHNTASDCWIIINNQVYDVSRFLNSHPGGKSSIMAFAGKDATEVFYDLHKKNVLDKYGPKLVKGAIVGTAPKIHSEIIDKVTPFAEHFAVTGWKSPFFNQSHHSFRVAVRKILQDNIATDAEQMEEAAEDPSPELLRKLGDEGIWAARIGVAAVPWIKKGGLKLPGGQDPEKLDYFHEQIAHEEIAHLGVPGLADGLGAGLIIGLPPVIHFGTPALQERTVAPTLRGEKVICLAISEPFAGSDVAGLRTRARKIDGGWLVTGQKRWITTGISSDMFTVAVRTGGKGFGGISLMVVDRDPAQVGYVIPEAAKKAASALPDAGKVRTSRIKTSYSGAAGTANVFFEEVFVPDENVLLGVNKGFQVVMFNFNHERWCICLTAVQYMRLAVTDSYKWAMQRKIFGKKLIDQPVIRFKLAQMSAALEMCQSWLDAVTYQMNNMSYEEQNKQLGGVIALLKFHITRNSQLVSDNACQVFGGRSITRTGLGAFVERNARSYKFTAIYGGSEEILADLGVKQVVKRVDDLVKADKSNFFLAKL